MNLLLMNGAGIAGVVETVEELGLINSTYFFVTSGECRTDRKSTRQWQVPNLIQPRGSVWNRSSWFVDFFSWVGQHFFNGVNWKTYPRRSWMEPGSTPATRR